MKKMIIRRKKLLIALFILLCLGICTNYMIAKHKPMQIYPITNWRWSNGIENINSDYYYSQQLKYDSAERSWHAMSNGIHGKDSLRRLDSVLKLESSWWAKHYKEDTLTQKMYYVLYNTLGKNSTTIMDSIIAYNNRIINKDTIKKYARYYERVYFRKMSVFDTAYHWEIYNDDYTYNFEGDLDISSKDILFKVIWRKVYNETNKFSLIDIMIETNKEEIEVVIPVTDSNWKYILNPSLIIKDKELQKRFSYDKNANLTLGNRFSGY